MPKSHVVKLTINNATDHVMQYKNDWFDSGRVADGWSWPETISPGSTAIIECYEKDYALAGCSGYANYSLANEEVTIAFSNPVAGSNKLGVGTGGKTVWDQMDNHDYKDFTIGFKLGNEKFLASCHCTGGDVNDAQLTLE